MGTIKTFAVSACLLGHKVRYDGSDKLNADLLGILYGHNILSICPETLGGLSTPRDPAEIIGNKVITKNGKDVTENYQKGARLAIENMKKYGVDAVILKSKSPACGLYQKYDGSFSGKLVEGNGITAQMLLDEGFKVFSDTELFAIEEYAHS